MRTSVAQVAHACAVIVFRERDARAALTMSFALLSTLARKRRRGADMTGLKNMQALSIRGSGIRLSVFALETDTDTRDRVHEVMGG